MTDTGNSHHRQVLNKDGDEPYIVLRLTDLERVTSLFDANKLDYWVDEEAISIDGEPEIIYVTLENASDADRAQRLLKTIF